MKLSIKNLGPISEGTVDLSKPLTILTGPNNTGKSYLTYLIHAINQHELINDTVSVRSKTTNVLSNSDSVARLINEGDTLDVLSLIQDKTSQLSALITENIQDNIYKIFISSEVKPQIEVTLDKIEDSSEDKFFRKLQIIDGRLCAIHSNGAISSDVFYAKVFSKYPDIQSLARRAIYISYCIYMDEQIADNTYFFPAERTAINMFAKHITSTKADIKDNIDNELLSNMSDEEIGRRLRMQAKAAPKYPYAIREYINFVNDFQQGGELGKLAFIADNIESILAGGSLNLDAFNQPIFTPKDSILPLELHLSSSLVKSLSYLILYLRYTAQQGDLVIIDEPELNLHPNMQVGIAKIIAEMVNEGLRVIISTHSDYLIKELNNLVLLHELNETESGRVFVQEKGYTSTQLLDKKQVGAYYLNNNTIKPIEVEATGVEVPSINDTINTIDSLTEEILYQL